jgi:multiple sugar transport system substrate-binding protein
MAEFFTRPNEGLYGIGVYTQVDFEALTIGFENVFFSFGADWFDQNNNVLGVVYSPEAIAALELYRELYSFAPPGTDNAFFAEMNDVFINGQAAMIMNFFAFFPVLENPTNNPYADVTGYFPIPAGPNGDRFTTIGGQSLSVNTYVSDERQQAALDFIQWFAQDEVQSRWAELGGFTTNTTVLQSPEFVAIAPANPAFAESMTMLKDFWRIPGNETLLESTQRWLHAYIVGSEGNAEEILINLAFEQHEILVEMGIILE